MRSRVGYNAVYTFAKLNVLWKILEIWLTTKSLKKYLEFITKMFCIIIRNVYILININQYVHHMLINL